MNGIRPKVERLRLDPISYSFTSLRTHGNIEGVEKPPASCLHAPLHRSLEARLNRRRASKMMIKASRPRSGSRLQLRFGGLRASLMVNYWTLVIWRARSDCGSSMQISPLKISLPKINVIF